jgi:pre-mRNA-processing factor 6
LAGDAAFSVTVQVSADEWEAIPDIGDYTVKKRPRTTYAPAPDSLISAAANAQALANSVGPDGMATPMSGTASVVSDLTAMGELGVGFRFSQSLNCASGL